MSKGCCDKCGSPIIEADARQKFDALKAFAESIVRGEYGPGLMDARIILQENGGILAFIGELDAELRNRAKDALSGGKLDSPPKHFAKSESP